MCKGCFEEDGYVQEWAKTGRCKIHACARNHNVQFCGLCSEFPCDNISKLIYWNPDIIKHIKVLKEEYNSSIFNCILNISNIKLKNIALEFANFLSENGMIFEKAGGYWDKQSYWYVKYKNEFVCYILVNATDDEEKFYPFTVWTDDTNSDWYSSCNLESNIENNAIKHIDFCENCGACKGGTEKQIFRKKYFNVCRTTFRFINPDVNDIKCIDELVLLRKKDIERIKNDIK